MRLEVTRRTDLAIRALQHLHLVGKQRSPELAEAIGTSRGFVNQVMTPLVRAGWVASEPGPTGGYRPVVDLRRVSVLDVIEAVEGPLDPDRCVLRGGPCSAVPCALHEAWISARRALASALGSEPVIQEVET